jgi:ribonuclease HI
MDNLSLTPRRKNKNKEARDKNGEITFDPSVTREGDLSSHFRIFIEPNAICHNPALRPIQPANIIRNETSVYTEGDCNVDELGNISAGSGIWYGPSDERNMHLRLRSDINSNQFGELAAILWAITEEPPQNELTITTNSAYALDGVLNSPKNWEPIGYIGICNKNIFRSIIAALRSRGGVTRFKKASGDSNIARYTEAKKLAKQGTTKEEYDEPNRSTIDDPDAITCI